MFINILFLNRKQINCLFEYDLIIIICFVLDFKLFCHKRNFHHFQVLSSTFCKNVYNVVIDSERLRAHPEVHLRKHAIKLENSSRQTIISEKHKSGRKRYTQSSSGSRKTISVSPCYNLISVREHLAMSQTCLSTFGVVRLETLIHTFTVIVAPERF